MNEDKPDDDPTLVTRESALAAIKYLNLGSSTDRMAYAIRMLVQESPAKQLKPSSDEIAQAKSDGFNMGLEFAVGYCAGKWDKNTTEAYDLLVDIRKTLYKGKE